MRRWDVLAGLIKGHDLRIGVEVGVNQGANMRAVLDRCPRFKWTGVDDWRGDYLGWDAAKRKLSRDRFRAVERKYPNRVRLLEMDSIEAAATIPDASIDLVFIDADHEYEGVRDDIAAWAPKVRPGGILAGHDYDQPDFPGVRKAVDEFCQPNIGSEWVWWTRF